MAFFIPSYVFSIVLKIIKHKKMKDNQKNIFLGREIHVCKAAYPPFSRASCAGSGGGEGGWQGRGFSAEASNQISLMKWKNVTKPIGSEKKDIRVLFS